MAAPARTEKREIGVREFNFVWEGKDKGGKIVRGELRAASQAVVSTTLRRQAITTTKIKKQSLRKGGTVSDKDVALFTRQLATMMRAGVPLLQAFDIVGKGSTKAAVTRLLTAVRTDVETGSALSQAFRKHPVQFDALYCNLIQAGEQAGILEAVLERLAAYKEKILAIKSKIKAAMFYPISIVAVAFIVVAVLMLFVIPSFKGVFKSFGAELPAPTLFVIAISDAFVNYWYIIFAIVGGGLFAFFYVWKRSVPMQVVMDRFVLKLPIFGDVLRKATLARWSRTLSTMFAAGVPLVEALTSVGGAAGNHVYKIATQQIQNEVSTGSSLTVSMQNTNVFPSMVVQMVSIGEESGQLDSMLGKVADFYEQEVDDSVDALSSLLEPIIMVFLGVVIGGIVVAMYLPIFKLGSVL